MIFLYGFNYRNSPVALRERLAFSEDDVPPALGRLLECPGVGEAMILSTCNRVEILTRLDGAEADGRTTLRNFLAAERRVPAEDLERDSYHLADRDAVRHLFRVASGLDSMILGEPQILGQVKQAYAMARRARGTDAILERLLQQCLATAKRVRTETGISRNAVSVAYAAVGLARRIFGTLEGRTALIVGAGKMGELVAKHLRSNGIGGLEVTSRTYCRAVRSGGRTRGRPVAWERAIADLAEVDIVVSCTAAPGTVLDREMIARALKSRRGRSLLMIDIAVPRDIDPAVNELDNAYLYDIDALQSVADANVEKRRQAATLAEAEIERDVRSFLNWRDSLEITPTIVSLRERVEAIGARELHRHRRRLGSLSAEQSRALDDLIRGVVQKILHRPVVHLRKSAERGDMDSCAAVYREIFGLDRSMGEQPRSGSTSRGPRKILRGGKDD